MANRTIALLCVGSSRPSKVSEGIASEYHESFDKQLRNMLALDDKVTRGVLLLFKIQIFKN